MVEPTLSSPSDAEARRTALDPERSFIVQAPAGSGKTELLIRRFLTLLARVDAPEEIVAITFTRKAAGEMRDRVLRALVRAKDDSAPELEHDRATWTLARAARDRDAERGWGVSTSPSRLSIQTIDALCAGLTRQMPVLSGFAAHAEPAENATDLYIEAARRVLAHLDEDDASAASVGRVLIHLDNDVESAQSLLAQMLERRDQWLRHVADPGSRRMRRESLESALSTAIVEALEDVRDLFPADVAEELLTLARYAAANLERSGRPSAVVQLLALESLPGASIDQLPLWRAIAGLLLTADGDLRRKVDADLGFPAAGDAKDKLLQSELKRYKARFQALLEQLAAYRSFLAALARTRRLPPPTYTESQWEVVEAVTGLLPLAVAELELLFHERAQIDFAALSQAAVRALGSEEEPTDLALALDYRIRHLLVDEFQDTSLSQFELLEHLTAGWQPGDGRTLFAVGDPMQSIYRFREAEVGLYLQARNRGVGALKLEPLLLQVNFRSQRGIVDWANESFRTVLPDRQDVANGAVPFAPSGAMHPSLPGVAVAVHPMLQRDRAAEARIILRLIQEAQRDDPSQRVAVLVRNRSHLSAIIPALRNAGLRFQALDIEALGDRPVVKDLFALTRALLHPGDRAAWLSILRAPWCGLSLADLDALAGRDRGACVWDLMERSALVERLSVDGQRRLRRLQECVEPCLAHRRRGPLRRWIEGAWLALGGPATAERPADLQDAGVFLDVLEELEEGADVLQLEALARRVAGLFAAPDADAGETLQLMTIHKAKGLEFDTVIVPGLGLEPRSSDPQLLLWAERWREHGPADLLLAPIRGRAPEEDAIYRYLSQLEETRAKHEEGRLLYVAATRAKSRLHLVGHAETKRHEVKPSARSLLARLWPVLEPHFQRALDDTGVVVATGNSVPPPDLAIRRLASEWARPEAPAAVVESAVQTARQPVPRVEFSWVSESARHVGTVVHRAFQLIAAEGLSVWDRERVRSLRDRFAAHLRALGVPVIELERALERVVNAVDSALADPRARWLLSPHDQSQSEWHLTGWIDGAPVDVVLDRTFVDEHRVRWIVDFKTGEHEGAEVERFLDNEVVRYRDQLERYAALVSRLESRPIRLGLYFPLLRGWREWEYAGEASAARR